MTGAVIHETGLQRFRRFRELLREHGFRLQCANQVTDRMVTSTVTIERWIAHNTETGKSTMFVVLISDEWIDIYLQSQTLAMQDDVAALVRATGGDPGEGHD